MEWMNEPLTWHHPLALTVYGLSLLNFACAGLLFWFHQKIILPQGELLRENAYLIYENLVVTQNQLKLLNRQADRSLDQLEKLFNLMQGFFLALLETRLIALLMRKLRRKPIFVRMVVTKGISATITQLEAAIRTRKIEDRDEEHHEIVP